MKKSSFFCAVSLLALLSQGAGTVALASLEASKEEVLCLESGGLEAGQESGQERGAAALSTSGEEDGAESMPGGLPVGIGSACAEVYLPLWGASMSPGGMGPGLQESNGASLGPLGFGGLAAAGSPASAPRSSAFDDGAGEGASDDGAREGASDDGARGATDITISGPRSEDWTGSSGDDNVTVRSLDGEVYTIEGDINLLAGNDTVTFQHMVKLTGDIDTGAGNDTIHIYGPFSGSLKNTGGSAGTTTLVLQSSPRIPAVGNSTTVGGLDSGGKSLNVTIFGTENQGNAYESRIVLPSLTGTVGSGKARNLYLCNELENGTTKIGCRADIIDPDRRFAFEVYLDFDTPSGGFDGVQITSYDSARRSLLFHKGDLSVNLGDNLLNDIWFLADGGAGDSITFDAPIYVEPYASSGSNPRNPSRSGTFFELDVDPSGATAIADSVVFNASSTAITGVSGSATQAVAEIRFRGNAGQVVEGTSVEIGRVHSSSVIDTMTLWDYSTHAAASTLTHDGQTWTLASGTASGGFTPWTLTAGPGASSLTINTFFGRGLDWVGTTGDDTVSITIADEITIPADFILRDGNDTVTGGFQTTKTGDIDTGAGNDRISVFWPFFGALKNTGGDTGRTDFHLQSVYELTSRYRGRSMAGIDSGGKDLNFTVSGRQPYFNINELDMTIPSLTGTVGAGKFRRLFICNEGGDSDDIGCSDTNQNGNHAIQLILDFTSDSGGFDGISITSHPSGRQSFLTYKSNLTINHGDIRLSDMAVIADKSAGDTITFDAPLFLGTFASSGTDTDLKDIGRGVFFQVDLDGSTSTPAADTLVFNASSTAISGVTGSATQAVVEIVYGSAGRLAADASVVIGRVHSSSVVDTLTLWDTATHSATSSVTRNGQTLTLASGTAVNGFTPWTLTAGAVETENLVITSSSQNYARASVAKDTFVTFNITGNAPTWTGTFTAHDGGLNDDFTLPAGLTASGAWNLGGGVNAIRRAATGTGNATISGKVTLGAGNDRIGGLLVSEHTTGTVAEDETAKSLLAMGEVDLGGGTNKMRVASAGKISAGGGDDTVVVAGAVTGDVSLGAGTNVLEAVSLTGNYAKGLGSDTVTLAGNLTGSFTSQRAGGPSTLTVQSITGSYTGGNGDDTIIFGAGSSSGASNTLWNLRGGNNTVARAATGAGNATILADFTMSGGADRFGGLLESEYPDDITPEEIAAEENKSRLALGNVLLSDGVNKVRVASLNRVEGGRNDDTVVVSGNVATGVHLHAGNNTLIVGGTIGGSVFAGDGNDTVSFGGGGGGVTLGGGNNSLTISSGTWTGTLIVGGGSDTVVVASGATLGAASSPPALELGTGSDAMRGAGTINSMVVFEGATSPPEDETIGIDPGGSDRDLSTTDNNPSGAEVAAANSLALPGGVDFGDGDNRMWAASASSITGGTGDDYFVLSGSVSGAVSLSGSGGVDNGDNVLVVGGTIGGLVSSSTTGSDTVSIGGGAGNVNLGNGTNTLTISSGTWTGTYTGGSGVDTIVVASGAVMGPLNSPPALSLAAGADTLRGAGTITNAITLGAADNTIGIDPGGADGDPATTADNPTDAEITAANALLLRNVTLGNGTNKVWATFTNSITGGDGADSIYLTNRVSGGVNVLGTVNLGGGAGDNTLVVVGGVTGLISSTTTGTDTVSIGGGIGNVNLGDGTNTLTISSGTWSGTYADGSNADTIVVASGAALNSSTALSLGFGADILMGAGEVVNAVLGVSNLTIGIDPAGPDGDLATTADNPSAAEISAANALALKGGVTLGGSTNKMWAASAGDPAAATLENVIVGLAGPDTVWLSGAVSGNVDLAGGANSLTAQSLTGTYTGGAGDDTVTLSPAAAITLGSMSMGAGTNNLIIVGGRGDPASRRVSFDLGGASPGTDTIHLCNEAAAGAGCSTAAGGDYAFNVALGLTTGTSNWEGVRVSNKASGQRSLLEAGTSLTLKAAELGRLTLESDGSAGDVVTVDGAIAIEDYAAAGTGTLFELDVDTSASSGAGSADKLVFTAAAVSADAAHTAMATVSISAVNATGVLASSGSVRIAEIHDTSTIDGIRLWDTASSAAATSITVNDQVLYLAAGAAANQITPWILTTQEPVEDLTITADSLIVEAPSPAVAYNATISGRGTWAGTFTAASGGFGDTITIAAEMKATGEWNLHGGDDTIKRAATGAGSAEISGRVLMGAGDDRIGGLLESEYTSSTTQTEKDAAAAESMLAMGNVELGEGNNKMRVASAGDIRAGGGNDMVVVAGAAGYVQLGNGNNTLKAGSLARYGGGSGNDTVEVSGAIAGQVELRGSATAVNSLMAQSVGGRLRGSDGSDTIIVKGVISGDYGGGNGGTDILEAEWVLGDVRGGGGNDTVTLRPGANAPATMEFSRSNRLSLGGGMNKVFLLGYPGNPASRRMVVDLSSGRVVSGAVDTLWICSEAKSVDDSGCAEAAPGTGGGHAFNVVLNVNAFPAAPPAGNGNVWEAIHVSNEAGSERSYLGIGAKIEELAGGLTLLTAKLNRLTVTADGAAGDVLRFGGGIAVQEYTLSGGVDSGTLFELDLDPAGNSGAGASDQLVFTSAATDIAGESGLTSIATVRIAVAPGDFDANDTVTIARTHSDSSITSVRIWDDGRSTPVNITVGGGDDTIALGNRIWRLESGTAGADGFTPWTLTAGESSVVDLDAIAAPSSSDVDRSGEESGGRLAVTGSGTWSGSLTAADRGVPDSVTLGAGVTATGAWSLGNGVNAIARAATGSGNATIEGAVTMGKDADRIGGLLESEYTTNSSQDEEEKAAEKAAEEGKSMLAMVGAVNLGDGNNIMRVASSGDPDGALVTVITGGADADTVEVAGAVSGSVDLKGGANTIVVGSAETPGSLRGAYTGGGGIDSVTIFGSAGGAVALGAGSSNTLRVTGEIGGNVTSSSLGTDLVEMGGGASDVNLGGGANRLKLTAGSWTGAYIFGAGIDAIEVAAGATMGPAAGAPQMSFGPGDRLTGAGTVNNPLAFGDGASDIGIHPLGEDKIEDTGDDPSPAALAALNSLALAGGVSLGDGANEMRVASVGSASAGSPSTAINGGEGADIVLVSGSVHGNVDLKGGSNSLHANMLAGGYTGGAGGDFVTLGMRGLAAGEITLGAMSLGEGTNTLYLGGRGGASDAHKVTLDLAGGPASGADTDTLSICGSAGYDQNFDNFFILTPFCRTGAGEPFSVALTAAGAGANTWETINVLNEATSERSALEIGTSLALASARLNSMTIVNDGADGDTITLAGQIAIQPYDASGSSPAGTLFMLDLVPPANSQAGGSDTIVFAAGATNHDGSTGKVRASIQIVGSGGFASESSVVTIARVHKDSSIANIRVWDASLDEPTHVDDEGGILINRQLWTLSEGQEGADGFTPWTLTAGEIPFIATAVDVTENTPSIDSVSDPSEGAYALTIAGGGTWAGTFTALDGDHADTVTIEAGMTASGAWSLKNGANTIKRDPEGGQDVGAITGTVTLGAGSDRVGGLLESEYTSATTPQERVAAEAESRLAMTGGVDLGDGANFMRVASAGRTGLSGNAITGGGDADMVVVSGAITGSVSLEGGENTLAAGTLSGSYTGLGDSDTLIVGAGTSGGDAGATWLLGAGTNTLKTPPTLASGAAVVLAAVEMGGHNDRIGGLLESELTGSAAPAERAAAMNESRLSLQGAVNMGGGENKLRAQSAGAITGGADADTVEVAGAIGGDVNLGDGANALRAESLRRSYTGGSGSDTIIIQPEASFSMGSVSPGDGENRLIIVGMDGSPAARKATLDLSGDPAGTAGTDEVWICSEAVTNDSSGCGTVAQGAGDYAFSVSLNAAGTAANIWETVNVSNEPSSQRSLLEIREDVTLAQARLNRLTVKADGGAGDTLTLGGPVAIQVYDAGAGTGTLFELDLDPQANSAAGEADTLVFTAGATEISGTANASSMAHVQIIQGDGTSTALSALTIARVHSDSSIDGIVVVGAELDDDDVPTITLNNQVWVLGSAADPDDVNFTIWTLTSAELPFEAIEITAAGQSINRPAGVQGFRATFDPAVTEWSGSITVPEDDIRHDTVTLLAGMTATGTWNLGGGANAILRAQDGADPATVSGDVTMGSSGDRIGGLLEAQYPSGITPEERAAEEAKSQLAMTGRVDLGDGDNFMRVASAGTAALPGNAITGGANADWIVAAGAIAGSVDLKGGLNTLRAATLSGSYTGMEGRDTITVGAGASGGDAGAEWNLGEGDNAITAPADLASGAAAIDAPITMGSGNDRIGGLLEAEYTGATTQPEMDAALAQSRLELGAVILGGGMNKMRAASAGAISGGGMADMVEIAGAITGSVDLMEEENSLTAQTLSGSYAGLGGRDTITLGAGASGGDAGAEWSLGAGNNAIRTAAALEAGTATVSAPIIMGVGDDRIGGLLAAEYTDATTGDEMAGALNQSRLALAAVNMSDGTNRLRAESTGAITGGVGADTIEVSGAIAGSVDLFGRANSVTAQTISGSYTGLDGNDGITLGAGASGGDAGAEWNLGDGENTLRTSAALETGAAAIAAPVTMGAGGDRIGGLLEAEYSISTTGDERAAALNQSRLELAAVSMGEGENKLRAMSTGAITGGDMADAVEVAGAISGDVDLKAGANTLRAASLAGSYTGGGDSDTIVLTPDASFTMGALSLGAGANTLFLVGREGDPAGRRAALDLAGGLPEAQEDTLWICGEAASATGCATVAGESHAFSVALSAAGQGGNTWETINVHNEPSGERSLLEISGDIALATAKLNRLTVKADGSAGDTLTLGGEIAIQAYDASGASPAGTLFELDFAPGSGSDTLDLRAGSTALPGTQSPTATATVQIIASRGAGVEGSEVTIARVNSASAIDSVRIWDASLDTPRFVTAGDDDPTITINTQPWTLGSKADPGNSAVTLWTLTAGEIPVEDITIAAADQAIARGASDEIGFRAVFDPDAFPSGAMEWSGDITVTQNDALNDTIALLPGMTATGTWSLGGGGNAILRASGAESGQAIATVSGAVTLGDGNDRIGGLLESEYASNIIAEDRQAEERKSLLAMAGRVSLGGGDNTMRVASAGDPGSAAPGTAIEAGDGDDTIVVEGAITGDVDLMGGENSLAAASLAGSYTGGAGKDTIVIAPKAHATLGTINAGEGENAMFLLGSTGNPATRKITMDLGGGPAQGADSDTLYICDGVADTAAGRCAAAGGLLGRSFNVELTASGASGNTWETVIVSNDINGARSLLQAGADMTLGFARLNRLTLKADGSAGDDITFGGQIAIQPYHASTGSGTLFELDLDPAAAQARGSADTLVFTADSKSLGATGGLAREAAIQIVAGDGFSTAGKIVTIARVHADSSIEGVRIWDTGLRNPAFVSSGGTISLNRQEWTLGTGDAGDDGYTPWTLTAGELEFDPVTITAGSSDLSRASATKGASITISSSQGTQWSGDITAPAGDLGDTITIAAGMTATGDWSLGGGANEIKRAAGTGATATISGRVTLGAEGDTIGGGEATSPESMLAMTGGVDLGEGTNVMRVASAGRPGLETPAITGGGGTDTVEVSGSVTGGVNLGDGANTLAARSLAGGYTGGSGSDTVILAPTGAMSPGTMSMGDGFNRLFLSGRAGDPAGRRVSLDLGGGASQGGGNDNLWICSEGTRGSGCFDEDPGNVGDHAFNVVLDVEGAGASAWESVHVHNETSSSRSVLEAGTSLALKTAKLNNLTLRSNGVVGDVISLEGQVAIQPHVRGGGGAETGTLFELDFDPGAAASDRLVFTASARNIPNAPGLTDAAHVQIKSIGGGNAAQGSVVEIMRADQASSISRLVILGETTRTVDGTQTRSLTLNGQAWTIAGDQASGAFTMTAGPLPPVKPVSWTDAASAASGMLGQMSGVAIPARLPGTRGEVSQTRTGGNPAFFTWTSVESGKQSQALSRERKDRHESSFRLLSAGIRMFGQGPGAVGVSHGISMRYGVSDSGRNLKTSVSGLEYSLEFTGRGGGYVSFTASTADSTSERTVRGETGKFSLEGRSFSAEAGRSFDIRPGLGLTAMAGLGSGSVGDVSLTTGDALSAYERSTLDLGVSLSYIPAEAGGESGASMFGALNLASDFDSGARIMEAGSLPVAVDISKTWLDASSGLYWGLEGSDLSLELSLGRAVDGGAGSRQSFTFSYDLNW